jgi:hypothetical protein
MGAGKGGRGPLFFFSLLELETILKDTFVQVFVAVHYKNTYVFRPAYNPLIFVFFVYLKGLSHQFEFG